MSVTKDTQEARDANTEVHSEVSLWLKIPLEILKCFVVGSVIMGAFIGFGWIVMLIGKIEIVAKIFVVLFLVTIPTILGGVVLYNNNE